MACVDTGRYFGFKERVVHDENVVMSEPGVARQEHLIPSIHIPRVIGRLEDP
jgi:hypothetical protein